MPKARSKTKTTKARRPHCNACGKTIRVPDGWSVGPAVRRHYWAKHRAVMTAWRDSR